MKSSLRPSVVKGFMRLNFLTNNLTNLGISCNDRDVHNITGCN
jgi:hypothetical protein